MPHIARVHIWLGLARIWSYVDMLNNKYSQILPNMNI